MSRGWLVVLVVALVAGGLALALAAGLFEGEGGTTGAAEPMTTETGTVATAAPSTSTPIPTSTAAPTTTLDDDALCIAYDAYVQAIESHLPVTDAEDLEIFLTAGVEFYTEAVDLIQPPEQEAFAELLAYQRAQHDYSEAHDWNPSPPLEELLDDPPPTAPAAATETVAGVLQDRCGVEIVQE